MSNFDVLLIVLAGASLGGGGMLLAWRVGFMQGERKVTDHWLKAIETEKEVEGRMSSVESKAANASNIVPLYPEKLIECNCGGLCPSCANLMIQEAAEKKIGFT